MKHLKKTLLAVLGLTAFMAACADGPMAPEADLPLAAAFGRGGNNGGGTDDNNGGTNNGHAKLSWLSPVNGSSTYSATCTPNAGCLITGERGLVVDVPSGALSETTEISVTIMNGSTVDFEFQPHGLVFNAAITVSIDASETDAANIKGSFFALYWNSDPDQTEEVLDAEKRKGRFIFHPEHFSGYAIAM